MAAALIWTQPEAALGAQRQSEAFARSDPARHQMLDRASARSLANALVPIIADDVIDGERFLVRSLPVGREVGISYRFRLRAEPVRLRPFCRMRIVNLYYEWAESPTAQVVAIEDLDLLALKRAGRFGRGGIEARNLYLPLEAAPDMEEERRARCEAADRNQGWLPAADDSSFSNELWHLGQLREALADGRRGPTLRCWRDGAYGCPVSKEMILQAIESERRSFDAMVLADQSGWAQFNYHDEVPYGEGGEIRSVIIESRLGSIISVTLAYGLIVGAVI